MSISWSISEVGPHLPRREAQHIGTFLGLNHEQSLRGSRIRFVEVDSGLALDSKRYHG